MGQTLDRKRWTSVLSATMGGDCIPRAKSDIYDRLVLKMNLSSIFLLTIGVWPPFIKSATQKQSCRFLGRSTICYLSIDLGL